MFIKIALRSLFNRRGSVLLTLLAVCVSCFVLLGVEQIRQQAKANFNSTISGVDLIVGARTGSLNLLLYSVFRVGTPTNNIKFTSYEEVASDPNVAWSIPISLGDSHKGFRVMGTTGDYFKHFSYGAKHKLGFSSGRPFDTLFDVVLGSAVAAKLGYKLGDKLILSHGTATSSFSQHDDTPFRVSGILAATGTPVDQTLHVSLEAIEAIHINWQNGIPLPGNKTDVDRLRQLDLQPRNITAFMLGLKSKVATFRLTRTINNYRNEPLMAILPGVTLSELWQMTSLLENTLRLISVLTLIASLLGLSAMLLASIRERSEEIRLLRAIGAPPIFLFLLIELEAVIISLTAIALSLVGLYTCIVVAGELLTEQYGLHLSSNIFSQQTLILSLTILLSTTVAVAIPATRAFSNAKEHS